MVLRKIALAAATAALMSTPAWALPAQGADGQGKGHRPSSVPVGPPSTTPNDESNPGSTHRHHGDVSGSHKKGDHGASHRCVAHRVAYVASGTLVSQTLTKNEDGTYSGELVVEVSHTNHHAAADRGKTVTYNLVKAHLVLALADTNSDGSVGVDDLAKGDRVHLIGGITRLHKKCPTGEFTPETKVRMVVVHAPATTDEAAKS